MPACLPAIQILMSWILDLLRAWWGSGHKPRAFCHLRDLWGVRRGESWRERAKSGARKVSSGLRPICLETVTIRTWAWYGSFYLLSDWGL